MTQAEKELKELRLKLSELVYEYKCLAIKYRQIKEYDLAGDSYATASILHKLLGGNGVV